jgi:hypothetical protein
MTCTRCGHLMMDGTYLCASCWVAALPADQPRGGRQLVIAVAALVVAAAIAGTAVAFARFWPHPGSGRAAAAQQQVPAAQLQGPGIAAMMPAAGAAPAIGPGGAAALGPAVSLAPGRIARRLARHSGPLVAVIPMAAGGPHEDAVLTFLTRYFTAINRHRYRAYLRLFSPESRSSLPGTQFSAGYQPTRNVRPTLIGLKRGGPGRLAATVAFTSHRRGGSIAPRAACVHWIITLYLVRDGRRYVIGNPPAGYVANRQAC